MSRLFIELYLDEDVNVLVAELLRARGFSVQTTQEAARTAATDDEQLTYAVSQRRAFLTHNRDDFARLTREYFASGNNHFGVVIAVRRPPHELVRRLLVILNQITSDEAENQLIYI